MVFTPGRTAVIAPVPDARYPGAGHPPAADSDIAARLPPRTPVTGTPAAARRRCTVGDVGSTTVPGMDSAEVVTRLWNRNQSRDWAAVRELLADDLVTHWPVTGETFVGPDDFVAVQREYPEGWSIHLLRVIADGDRVVAEVEVPQEGVGVFRAASFAEVVGGRIAAITEYWVTVDSEVPPDWRAPYRKVH